MKLPRGYGQVLADYLETNVDYILNGSEYSYADIDAEIATAIRRDHALKDAVNRLRNLSPKNRDYVIELIHILSEGEGR